MSKVHLSHRIHVSGLPSEFARNIATFLASNHLSVMQHGGIEDFLTTSDEVDASCLITNLHPEQNSITDILQRPIVVPNGPTVILITNSHDVAGAVRAMKEGAMEVFEDPIYLPSLLSAVYEALERNRRVRTRRFERMELKRRYERLTKRERQVLPLVLGGWLIKQGAAALGIADITMQTHRRQIMRKMEANSLADLVRMGVKLGIRHTNSFTQESVKVGSRTLLTVSNANSEPNVGREAKAV